MSQGQSRDTVKLLGVTLDSALTMDQHVTQVIHICSYHTRALRHTYDHWWHSTLPRWWATVSSHPDWIIPTHCYTAHRRITSTGCNWHRTRCPEWRVKPHVPLVLPSYVSSSTGCLFVNGSTTRGRDQLAIRPTYIISSKIIYQHAHCDLRPSDKLLFAAPWTALAFSTKAFIVSASFIWNSLSYNSRSAELYSTFKCLMLTAIINVNTQPSLCHYSPLIRSRHTALYECVLIGWMIDWLIEVQYTKSCTPHFKFRSLHFVLRLHILAKLHI